MKKNLLKKLTRGLILVLPFGLMMLNAGATSNYDNNTHKGANRNNALIKNVSTLNNSLSGAYLATGVTLLPEADAYVRDGGSANANYGSETGLVLKKDGVGYTRETLLRFKLSDVVQTSALRAVLKLNITSANTTVTVGGTNKWQAYLIENDTWDEATITYNTKPTVGALITEVSAVGTSGAVVSFDITSAFNTELEGDGYISILIVATVQNGTSDVTFASKEHATEALRPVIVTENILLTSPNDNTNFTSNGSVTISADASQGGITNPLQKVEFYANGSKIGEASSAPYEYTTTSLAKGVYSIMAKAVYQDASSYETNAIAIGVGHLLPEADTYAQGGNGTTNYGLNERLLVKRDNNTGTHREIFLRFKMSDITDPSFGKAILRLNETSTNANFPATGTIKWELYLLADDAWGETTLTYNNRPTASRTFMVDASAVKMPTNGSPVPIEWDITSFVNTELAGDKKISIALVGSVSHAQGDVYFASKENADITLRPVLKLYTEQEVLPVNFISFAAKATTSGVQLNWKVASETDHKQYIVSRSTNGTDYTVVATTTAHSATDNNVAAGTYYYKLEQQDNDGKVNYLATQVVKVGLAANGVIAYPNPTQGNISIAVTAGAYSKYSVVSLQGTTVASGAISSAATQLNVNLTGLAAGTYIVKLTGTSGNAVTRVIKL